MMGSVVLGALCSQNTLVLYCTQILHVVSVVLGCTWFTWLEPVYYTSTSNETQKKDGVCGFGCVMFPKYPSTILYTNPTRSRSSTRFYTVYTVKTSVLNF